MRIHPRAQSLSGTFFWLRSSFFAKVPAKIETINDLDGNVVNFFQVARNQPEDLAHALELTPYARDEYEASFIKCDGDDDVEKARKFAVRCWMGIGCSNRYKNGFRSGQRSSSPSPAKSWDTLPALIAEAAMRLKNAQIENLPAIELLKRYDTTDVFVYADPPYLPGTRKGYLYKHEMGEEEHMKLLEALKQHPGKVLLSGYENSLYNDVLHGWRKVHKKTQVEGGHFKTETLWMNYDLGQLELDFR